LGTPADQRGAHQELDEEFAAAAGGQLTLSAPIIMSTPLLACTLKDGHPNHGHAVDHQING
jgi:hypothetical protein